MQLSDNYGQPCYQAHMQKSPPSGVQETTEKFAKTSEWLWFTKGSGSLRSSTSSLSAHAHKRIHLPTTTKRVHIK